MDKMNFPAVSDGQVLCQRELTFKQTLIALNFVRLFFFLFFICHSTVEHLTHVFRLERC